MGRVINPEPAGKERTRLTRYVLIAVRELMKQPEVNQDARDLAAFIAEALQQISDSIDPSVEAWEKRGYWLKADRFRLEWLWTGQLAERLRASLLQEDWGAVAQTAAQAASKLSAVKLPQRPGSEQPWRGAWLRLNSR